MKQGFSPRALRISEQIQRELARCLREVKDPRVRRDHHPGGGHC